MTIILFFLQRNNDVVEPQRPMPASSRFQDVQNQIYSLADSDHPDAFAEYASVVASCDLVITAATTLSHLSGALGVPTWTLLHKYPDWRWGYSGRTTIWYSSMTLYRQSFSGSWDYPILQIKHDFSLFVKTLP